MNLGVRVKKIKKFFWIQICSIYNTENGFWKAKVLTDLIEKYFIASLSQKSLFKGYLLTFKKPTLNRKIFY